LFAGSTIDINHRPATGVDWSRDATASGSAWQLTSHHPGYRPVKFRLPF